MHFDHYYILVIALICITPLHNLNIYGLCSIPFHYWNCPTDIGGRGNELKWTKLTQINRYLGPCGGQSSMCQKTMIKAKTQTEDKRSGGEQKGDRKRAHEEKSNEGLTLER